MKQLSTRTLAIIAFVAVTVLAIGVFAIQDKTKTPTPIMENGEGEKNQNGEEDGEEDEENEEFSKYNKVLERAKITGVKDLEGEYKKVTINNGEITFSFEVPDTWLVEARNSGEVEMNEEELREFLGTKWDWDEGEYFKWEDQYSDYANNPFSMNADYSDISSSYPEASVSHTNYISYAIQNLDQIDFSIGSESDMKELLKELLEYENVYFEDCLEVDISIDSAYSVLCSHRDSPLKYQRIFVSLEKKVLGVSVDVHFNPTDSTTKNDIDYLIQTFVVEINLSEAREG